MVNHEGINRVLNVNSVYDIDEYSIQGLVYQLLRAVNDLIDDNNAYKEELHAEMLKWVEFIKQNVSEEKIIAYLNGKIEAWYQEGKLNIGINDQLESLTSTYSSEKIKGLLNRSGIHVDDFGAVGDGVTDDADAIQRAFDYASHYAVDVRFSHNKIYAIAKGLILKPSVPVESLPGSGIHFTPVAVVNLIGRNGAQLKAIKPMQKMITVTSNSDIQSLGAWHLKVDGLTLNGNGMATQGLYLYYNFHTLLSHVRVFGCEYGIVSDTCSDTQLEYCTIKGKYCVHVPTGGDGHMLSNDLYPTKDGRGIWLGGYAGNYVLDSNTFSGEEDGGFNVGIWLDGTMTFNGANGLLAMVNIHNNEFSSLARGIKIVGKSPSEKTIYDISISKNHMTNSFATVTNSIFLDVYSAYNIHLDGNIINTHASNPLSFGVYGQDCENLTMTKNHFMNINRNAVDLNRCVRSLMDGNMFWNVGKESGDFTVILLRNTDSHSNVMINNRFKNDLATYSRFALGERDGADYNQAYDNTFIQNVLGYATPATHSICRRREYAVSKPTSNAGYLDGDVILAKYPTDGYGWMLVGGIWKTLSSITA